MNEQEMTFGQAVDWLGADYSRVVQLVNGSTLLRFNCASNQFEVSSGTGAWDADKNIRLNFSIKWRPYVAPKPISVIEEAIEREMKRHLFTVPSVKAVCCAVANATLDEAKKAAVGRNGELDDTSTCLVPVYVCERIDALKVTL